jgi:DNA-binding transcriptional LysR family regulator
MDTIDLFRIFIRVAENGSFIRTAETMNRPASTISAAIRELEARLETRLLHRTTRSVSLTSDGSALYARCLVVVQDVEETENLFRRASGQVTGKIKVDVPGRVGGHIVVPALPDFFARQPSIQVDLGVTDRSVNLPEEGIDCAVRVGVLNDSGMVARRVGYLKFINVVSPGYISSFGAPTSPEKLDNHVVVGYVSPTTGRKERWEWEQAGETLTTEVNSYLTVNSADAYIAACVAGMGMIQIPEYDVRELLDAGILLEVMPAFLPRSLPVSILYPSRRHQSRPLQLFIAWLEPLLREKMRLATIG